MMKVGRWGFALAMVISVWPLLSTRAQSPEVIDAIQQYQALNRQGLYVTAVPFAENAALLLSERKVGPDHRSAARLLGNLGKLYLTQGRYAWAEPLFKRALLVRRNVDQNRLEVAPILSDLALLYNEQGRYAEAEPLQLSALAIREKALGKSHPDVANDLVNLAALYLNQGRYADAEPLHERAQLIRMKLDPKRSDLVRRFISLDLRSEGQDRYAEAEPHQIRVLTILEKSLGPKHPSVVAGIYNPASRSYAITEPLFKHALAVLEETHGPDHPDVAKILSSFALFLRETGRADEAAKLEARVGAIGARHDETRPAK